MSCGSKNSMLQNLTYYTSLKRSNLVELIGVNLDPMALFGRSYGPSKFCKSALKNGLCSRVPGMLMLMLLMLMLYPGRLFRAC